MIFRWLPLLIPVSLGPVIALLLPALFHFTERSPTDATTASLLEEELSLGVSVVLIVVYIANLV